MNFPFHISYKWKGDKIIEDYQFFDLMAFENEENARVSQNDTNEKVGFVTELSIKKGFNVEEVKKLLKKLTEFMRTNEKKAYNYGYYISEDGKRITLIEKYLNSEATILHADDFEGGSNMKPFMDSFTIIFHINWQLFQGPTIKN